jgi:4,5-DOPA dioxygenase extradiol
MMRRSDFLKTMGALPALPLVMQLQQLHRYSSDFTGTDPMPVMFVGHGSPMNIIRDNTFTQSLARLGQKTPVPSAIMVVSAHWLTPRKTVVSVNPNPENIYDFGGFPEALYSIKYAPDGHPALAREVTHLVQSVQVHEDHEMGLDHGAWSILKHMYPEQKIPVFQLSIDYAKPPAFHYKLAQELTALRKKGVLIIGSGNIVHNLRNLDWSNEDAAPFGWAEEFDSVVKKRIDNGDHNALMAYQSLGKTAGLAVPTNDHYLPMLYSLGMLEHGEAVEYTFEGFQHGSISMRCFQSAQA